MTATERVLAEEIVPAIAQMLAAIQRLTVALALDMHVNGKLPPPPRKPRPAKRRKPANRRDR